MSRTIAIVALLFVAVSCARVAQAVEPYTYMAAVLGGVGGAFDATPDDGYDHLGFQIDLGVLTSTQALLVARVGQLDLGDGFSGLSGAKLRYANVAGEYRFDQPTYQSGIFLGLGAYGLAGDLASGANTDQTSIGAVVGFDGEFHFTRRWSLLVELAGHWADLDRASIFGTAHAGVAVHF